MLFLRLVIIVAMIVLYIELLRQYKIRRRIREIEDKERMICRAHELHAMGYYRMSEKDRRRVRAYWPEICDLIESMYKDPYQST